jgi:beta-glucosidase
MSSPQLFPGVDLTVNFGTGLDVGYRWYQANGVKPLFPFGFGLDYTSFKLSRATLKKTSSGVTVQVTVSNTGTRSGADVVQAYVKYPSSAGEPPEQLRAFNRVVLRQSSSRTITMAIPSSGFTVFQNGSFTTVAGSYGIDIGQSSADLSLHLNVTLH